MGFVCSFAYICFIPRCCCSEAGSKERRAIFSSEGFRRMIVCVSWRSIDRVRYMAGRG